MATARKLPSGSYRAKVKDYDDPEHPWKSFVASTPEETEFLAAEYRFKKKQRSKPENRMFGECMDAYIDGRSNILSPSTVALYRTLRKSAFTSIEKKAVGKITQADIQSCANDYSKDHAYKSVANAMAFLHVVFKEYRPDFQYSINMPMKVRSEMVIPTTDEVNDMIASSFGTPLYLPILLGALLGMRRSEICALTWDDINLKANTIRIDEALVLDEFNTFVRKNTKTANSKRTLELPKIVKAALPKESEPVISISPKEITRLFGKLAASKGYKFTFHSLRHYYASILLKLNVPDKYAMERMGHATNNMLKQVYQHTFADEQTSIAQKVDKFIDSEIGDNNNPS